MLKKLSAISGENIYFLALDIYLLDILISFNAKFGNWLAKIPYQFSVMMIIVVSMLVWKIMKQMYTRKEQINLFWFSLLFFFLIYFSHNYTYLPLLYLFIAASKDVDFNKVIRHYLLIHVVMFCVTVGGSLMHIFPNWQKFDSTTGFHAASLGYITIHAPILVYAITLFFIAYMKNKIKFWHVLIVVAVDTYVYVKDNIQMMYYVPIIAIICAYIIKCMYKKNHKFGQSLIVRAAAKFSFLVGGISAFYIALFYDASNASWNLLNEFLTGRPYFSNKAINYYGIHLFGQPIEWSFVQNEAYMYPDSAYIQATLNYGVVFIVFLFIVFLFVGKYAVKTNDAYLTLVVAVISMVSIVNPPLLYLYMTPWVLLFGKKIYSSSDRSKIQVS